MAAHWLPPPSHPQAPVPPLPSLPSSPTHSLHLYYPLPPSPLSPPDPPPSPAHGLRSLPPSSRRLNDPSPVPPPPLPLTSLPGPSLFLHLTLYSPPHIPSPPPGPPTLSSLPAIPFRTSLPPSLEPVRALPPSPTHSLHLYSPLPRPWTPLSPLLLPQDERSRAPSPLLPSSGADPAGATAIRTASARLPLAGRAQRPSIGAAAYALYGEGQRPAFLAGRWTGGRAGRRG